MEDNLKLNTKLFGFEGVIGRCDYLKNIIVISFIAFCFILPYPIWLFSNIQTSSDLYSLDDIFFEAPINLKFLFMTGLFLNFILSASNIIRRLNDINGEINNFLNTFVVFLFGLFNFCFVMPLQLCFLFFTTGIILEIILLFMRGKITGGYNYDNIKDFNEITSSSNWIEELFDKFKEKRSFIRIILFFIAVSFFVKIYLLVFIPTFISDDNTKNNQRISEQTVNKPAKQEPDFAPYMQELQAKIKKNWHPPKGQESKRVVLLFSIAKDGRLLNVKIKQSSGIRDVDDSALNAVKLTAFNPLPSEFKGDKVDIEFTFDYKVFGI